MIASQRPRRSPFGVIPALPDPVPQSIRIEAQFTGHKVKKEFIGHGLFISWIESKLDIGTKTAEKYMKLYEHQSKIALSTNLQEAYKQIETLEAQERQSKEERERNMIAEYRKTGKIFSGSKIKSFAALAENRRL